MCGASGGLDGGEDLWGAGAAEPGNGEAEELPRARVGGDEDDLVRQIEIRAGLKVIGQGEHGTGPRSDDARRGADVRQDLRGDGAWGEVPDSRGGSEEACEIRGLRGAGVIDEGSGLGVGETGPVWAEGFIRQQSLQGEEEAGGESVRVGEGGIPDKEIEAVAVEEFPSEGAPAGLGIRAEGLAFAAAGVEGTKAQQGGAVEAVHVRAEGVGWLGGFCLEGKRVLHGQSVPDRGRGDYGWLGKAGGFALRRWCRDADGGEI